MACRQLYIIVVCVLVCAFSEPQLKNLSSISISNPGFITLQRSPTTTAAWNIIISQFNGFPFSTDYVSIVRNIGSQETDHKVETISSDLHWPNEPRVVPGIIPYKKRFIKSKLSKQHKIVFERMH